MARLSDFLEAVYGTAERFKTVRASIQQSRNPYLAEGARGGDRIMTGC